MDKQQFRVLRWNVESKIRLYIDDESSVVKLTNEVMRTLLDELSAQVTERNRKRRDFLTFRRDPEVSVPGWAYRKPGTAPGFPT
ncbi:hypothetical protein QVM48_27925 [Pseudomonas soli]|jgi:hypothetical protein|uniref:hypothetical protein n=1 Tax=Pseudomonas soli TaxID=1306993 RepID=UPI00289548DE|nr:hypothetical protein [Pseudomonas soli]EKT4503703.1 hypothetical protein [Pseudomonas putida]MDT3717827.1 hypothetical protein [Pseudomonas soli]